MNNEQHFFLRVLSDYLNNRESTAENIDWGTLYEYSKQQQLQGIIYYQCKNFISDNSIKKALEDAYYASRYSYMQRLHIIDSLSDLFFKDNIEFSLVKGYEVAKLFKNPSLRTMGDTDIIIHPKDRDIVHNIMIKNGFSCTKNDGDEWYYYKNGFLFEVHDSMVHPHEGNEYLLGYFNNLWIHGRTADKYFKLDWNFHFCYLIQHLSGHLLFTGVGLRQFIDIVVVAQNTELDWLWIEKELSDLGLWEFTRICLGFCQNWFDVNFLVEVAELDASFFDTVTGKIFKDGVFGQYNQDNKVIAPYVDSLIYKDRTINASRFLFVIRILFPSYEVMKEKPYCKFLKHNKLLLPIGWIIRGVYSIFSHKNKTKIQFGTNDDIRKRVEMYKRWGL